MKDPIPGAEGHQPSVTQRLRARLPRMPELNKKKAGKIAETAGEVVLYGCGGALAALFFLTKPVTTVVLGAVLVFAGRALKKSDELRENIEKVRAAAAV